MEWKIGQTMKYDHNTFGIGMYGSMNTFLSCNDVDNSDVGVQVWGACGGSFVQGNIINDHKNGLLYGQYNTDGGLDGFASTPVQDLRGNQWWSLNAQGGGGSGDFGAVNLGGSGVEIELEQYRVSTNSGQNEEFLPTTLFPAIGIAADWFNTIPGNNFDCDASNICIDGVGYDPELVSDPDNVSLEDGQYDICKDGRTWIKNYQAYLQLSQIKWELLSHQQQQFLEQYRNSSLGKLAIYHTEIGAALRLSDYYRNQLQLRLNRINNNFRRLVEVDALLATDEFADNPQYLQDRQQFIHRINNNLRLANETALAAYDVRRSEVQSQIGKNAEIYTDNIQEDIEKLVREVFLRAIGLDERKISDDLHQKLEEILDGCPSCDGYSVLFARSLYAAIDEARVYNDRKGLCEDSRRVQDRTTKYVLPFSIYPNPATKEIFVTIEDSEQPHSYIFELIDINGKTLIRQLLPGSSFINLNNFASGVYTCKLSDQKGRVQQRKLVITK